MDLHVKVLAAFYLIFGVLGILGSLMVLLIFGGAAGIISMAAPNDRGLNQPDVDGRPAKARCASSAKRTRSSVSGFARSLNTWP